jgi:Skp family chaperone for outer membrane proteins
MHLRVLCIIIMSGLIMSGLFCLHALARPGESKPQAQQKPQEQPQDGASPTPTPSYSAVLKTNEELESKVKSLQKDLGSAQLFLAISGVTFILSLILVIVIFRKFHNLATSGNVIDAKREIQQSLDQTNNAVQNNLTATRTDLQNSLTTAKTDLQTTLQTLRSDVALARGETQTTLQIIRTEVASPKSKGEQ